MINDPITVDGKRTLLSVQFRLDTYENVYYRSIYTLMDLISDVGGVQEVLMVLGMLLGGAISTKLM